MGTTKRLLDRDTVRDETDCPRCGAKRGYPCTGVRGQNRISNHQARVDRAQRNLGFTPTDWWGFPLS